MITVGDCIAVVADELRMPVGELITGRDKAHTRARQYAMWLAKRHTRLSYPTIAVAFNRHHTTVMHAVEQVVEWRSTDPPTRDLCEKLEAGIAWHAAVGEPQEMPIADVRCPHCGSILQASVAAA